jgi:hypothetical protein
MKDALETFYQQKILMLQDRLIKQNFPWNVGFFFISIFRF